jgi:hypothetical protein
MRMGSRATRAAVVLLVLALLWVGLPVPYTYGGGVGNYDARRWGLYGWARVFERRAVSGSQVRTEYSATGLVLTIAASGLAAAAGGLWARGGRGQRAAGLLVVLAPAALLVVLLWWPAVVGAHGGAGGDTFYSRGQFGYLVERRGTFEPPGFLPSEIAIAGPVRLDFRGLAVTGVASVVVLAGAGWLGSRAGRWGRPGPPA